MLNLVSNAFKFTLEGEIAVSLRREGGHARLDVRDTGSGVPAHELPHLFERFHRVEGTRGRTHEGTGIGLALAGVVLAWRGGALTGDPWMMAVGDLREPTRFGQSLDATSTSSTR